ncbi:MAG: HEPN domain-containing protein [Sulfuricella sp.]|nr:HEPN domain-containing protein [Sulfuricella sp.]
MTASLEEARRFLNLAGDDLAAYRTLADAAHIRRSIALFHAQQAVEKCLKAVLFTAGVEFRRTHDLYELADKLEHAGVDLPITADDLGRLNPFAVDFRYDDQLIPALSREEVEAMTQEILAWATAMVEKVAQ